MDRHQMLQQATGRGDPWDILVIGGGATGVGIAVDAATRGYATLLLEQCDFGKGTSSRSTKLVHGGVRYLEQGNIPLVMEALHERGRLRQNAPHLVHELPFVVPSYAWWEGPFYGIGLKLYQVLSGRHGFGESERLTREETLARLPNLNPEGLRGGVVYLDGQFDDARLLIHLAATAHTHGATLLNYARVTGLHRGIGGLINGVAWEDAESGREHRAHARVVINATGPFTDEVRRLANPRSAPMITPSQGAHLVFDGSFLPGGTALMVPHTSDHRVMFAIPWHGHTLVGTTDTPLTETPLEPRPLAEEIDFILQTARLYFTRKPTRADVLCAFAGIRPLARGGDGGPTAALSRDHFIHIDQSGLLNIAGGKWTTYRHMAEQCVNQAASVADLPAKPCVTKALPLHGSQPHAESLGALASYGSDAAAVRRLALYERALAEPLDAALPIIGAEVVWAARKEMARTVEDVLARRTRALFLNVRAALRMAPRVAALLAAEIGRDANWEAEQVAAFGDLAAGYLVAE